MSSLWRLLKWWPVEKALVVACLLGLITLAIMVAGVLFGTPLWVIASMSVAQGLGVVAGLLFAISVAAEAGGASRRRQ
jgi:hypothetical protein